MLMSNQRYRVVTKRKECAPFDEFITKMEMRAFGWTDKGIEIDYSDTYDVYIDLEKEEATAKRRFNVLNTFRRIEPYSKSLLFKLLEAVMEIQSWIRRKLIFLLFGITLILVVAGVFEVLGTGEFGEYSILAISVLAVIYLPSFICALLGFFLRKLFRLDKKLKDSLENNGYERDQYI